MQLNEKEQERIWEILAKHTYPKEQLGFFTMHDLIKLIGDALDEPTI